MNIHVLRCEKLERLDDRDDCKRFDGDSSPTDHHL